MEEDDGGSSWWVLLRDRGIKSEMPVRESERRRPTFKGRKRG